MKYFYYILVNLLFCSLSFAQKTEYHVSIGSNISFSSFNDNIYFYPPISPTTAFFSYSPLPDNVYRKTIPKAGFQIQGNAFYKLSHKLSIGSGLKFLLYRHGYDQKFEDNPYDPFGKRWSNASGYNTPLASPSDYIRHTRIMYLAIPLQSKYQINRKVYIYSGINIATPLLVAQKRKSLSYITTQTGTYLSGSEFGYPDYNFPKYSTNFSESVLSDKSKSAFNTVNYGLQLGIGFNTSTYTSIKIDYNQGIGNTYSDIEENDGIKSLIRTLNFSYDCLLDL